MSEQPRPERFEFTANPSAGTTEHTPAAGSAELPQVALDEVNHQMRDIA